MSNNIKITNEQVEMLNSMCFSAQDVQLGTIIQDLLTGGSGVGKKVKEGGEIFNDYENNVAIGAYSHIEGYKNKNKSLKGYVPLSIDESIIVLTDVTGLETGKWLSKYIQTNTETYWQKNDF